MRIRDYVQPVFGLLLFPISIFLVEVGYTTVEEAWIFMMIGASAIAIWSDQKFMKKNYSKKNPITSICDKI